MRSSSLLKKGIYVDALRDCNLLIEKDPQNVNAYYLRGCIYEKMDLIDLSIQDFSKALELDPNHVNAAYARGACENKKGNFFKAIEFYNIALEKDKRMISPQCRISMKTANLILSPNDEGDISENSFNKKTIQNEVENEETRNNNSTTKFKEIKINETTSANNNLNNSVSLPQSKNLLGSAQNQCDRNSFKRGKISSNIKDESKTINSSILNTDNKKALTPSQDLQAEAEQLFLKGYEERKNKNFMKAIDYYTVAIEKFPNFVKAYFNRGFAYDKLANYTNALLDYNKAMELDPKNPYTYFNLGITYDKLRKFDEAIQCFSQAIIIIPTKPDFYQNRAYSFRKKEQYLEAIEDYSKAIKFDPKLFKVL